MRYIHKFKTEEEFYSQYNTSAYTEPWVSLTNEGGCDYFVGNIEGTGEATFHFAGMHKGGMYVFAEGTKEKITFISSLPGGIDELPPQITVGGVVYTYNGNSQGPSMYPYIWQSKSGYCLTEINCKVGDDALVTEKQPLPLITDKRTPEVGETINYINGNVEVISVHTPIVNTITYNKNLSFRVEVVQLPEASFTNKSLTLTITQEMLDEWAQHYTFSKASVEVGRQESTTAELPRYIPIVASINGEPVSQDEPMTSGSIFVTPPMTIEYLPIVNGGVVQIYLDKK